MFTSILTEGTTINISQVCVCMAVSLILGLGISVLYMYTSTCSKSFAITLALLPVLVQMVIMLVNGSIGTGVAILGAFGLVRFRSIPGSSKEIISVFFAMSVGLATGTGLIWVAVIYTVIIGVLFFILSVTTYGERTVNERDLKITIPENLEYAGLFDDIFEKYTSKSYLDSVKTTNLGSMFELRFKITLKSAADEKKMIDDIRCRNGNLTIMCGRQSVQKDVL
ncbi:MAG: DUF4956 domain-containing protein [Clostridium sp.]|nr:DUF4956 domain-containing protein [Clostridium sp.]